MIATTISLGAERPPVPGDEDSRCSEAHPHGSIQLGKKVVWIPSHGGQIPLAGRPPGFHPQPRKRLSGPAHHSLNRPALPVPSPSPRRSRWPGSEELSLFDPPRVTPSGHDSVTRPSDMAHWTSRSPLQRPCGARAAKKPGNHWKHGAAPGGPAQSESAT